MNGKRTPSRRFSLSVIKNSTAIVLRIMYSERRLTDGLFVLLSTAWLCLPCGKGVLLRTIMRERFVRWRARDFYIQTSRVL